MKGVAFALEPGESLAIIGPSAAGKTTLIRLLTGTLAPARARCGSMARMCTPGSARISAAMSATCRRMSNCSTARCSRTSPAWRRPPSEAVFGAAKLAGCHEMILRLPKGYETEIGEGGAHLSGGQRQQIGLARALFGEPRLVVLDEPNANLDAEGELALRTALATLKDRGVTVIVVGHRPALMARLDRLAILNEGTIEASGPAADILSRLSTVTSQTPIPAASRTSNGPQEALA